MKIVVFGLEQRTGALVGERVIDLNRAYAASLKGGQASEQAQTRVPAQLVEFIAAGKTALECAQQAIDHAQKSGAAGLVHEARGVKLHAPWPRKRMAMAGGNYAAHFVGMQANTYGRTDVTLESAAADARKLGHFGFYKVLDELAGPDDDVPYPKRTKYFDYEGEAAIVIGKRGKDIPASAIEEYVWGVTLVNDWTIRDQVPARALQFNVTKNFDRSATMGPCIVVGEHDFRNIDVETRVNGAVRQSFNSRDMIYSFGEILEHLSRDFTFVPGDIISGGTSSGTAADQTKKAPDGSRPLDLFLKIGDVVEVSSPQIGSIRNRIVQA